MDAHTYQRQVSLLAAQRYRVEIERVGQQIDLTTVTALELVFENVEVVQIDMAAVQDLWLVFPTGKLAKNPAGNQDVQGFYLQATNQPAAYSGTIWGSSAKPRLDDAFKRVQSYQDVTSLVLTSNGQPVTYSVAWSALSYDDQENLAQHDYQDADTLRVWALLPTTYRLVDLLTVSLSADKQFIIVSELSQQLSDYDDQQLRIWHRTTVDEMLSLRDFASPQPAQHLVVHYRAQEGDDPWQAMLHDDTDDCDYGGLSLMPYSELLGMDVAIDDDQGDFWVGVAWLLWEITLNGVEATKRQVAIATVARNLAEGQIAAQRLRQDTAKMKRFLDAYASQHVTDPNLATTIAHFWPLTAGRQERLGDQTVTILAQDADLLAEFMAKFGPAFERFH